MNLTARFTDWLRSALLRGPLPRTAAIRPNNRRRKAAIALGAAAVLLFGFQLALGIAAEESLYIRDPGYSDKEIRLARQELLNPEGPRIVMLGTSRTAAAFDAGTMRAMLGRGVVFNFGIPASGPITHLVYLKRLLADGHRPDLLILEVLPPTLADTPGGPGIPAGPLEGRFFYGDRLRHSELDTVIGYGFPADDVRHKWRQSVAVPCYALRFPIVGRLMPSALPWHLRFDWSRGCDDFGWGASINENVTPQAYAKGLQQARGEYQAILANLIPNGGGARALADVLALCRDERIAVRLVMMPEAAGFRAMYSPEVISRLHDYLERLCRDYGCEYTNAREWLDDTAFSDGHHMLRAGAREFTDRLYREVIRD
ncbi:MAG TPA: hypothetical protein VN641_13355 [Urbifossiella sp.]|nr:hypothetical protein [Urbifossiella sp.]